jgi:hypothetical protein
MHTGIAMFVLAIFSLFTIYFVENKYEKKQYGRMICSIMGFVLLQTAAIIYTLSLILEVLQKLVTILAR